MKTQLALIATIVFLISGCATPTKNPQAQQVLKAETLPERKTFTLPAQMEGLAKGLEEAGVKIIYGPNSVPPPEGISEAAKKALPNLPQVPLQAHDLKKLAALRKFVNVIDDATFAKLKTRYSMTDRVINARFQHVDDFLEVT